MPHAQPARLKPHKMEDSTWDAVATPLLPEGDAVPPVQPSSSGWDAVATTPPSPSASPPPSAWDTVASASARPPIESEEGVGNDEVGSALAWSPLEQRRPRRGRPNRRLQEALEALAPDADAPPHAAAAGPSGADPPGVKRSNTARSTSTELGIPATASISAPSNWVPPIVRGFRLPTATSRGLLHCWQAVEEGEVVLDEHYILLERHYCSPDSHHVSSRAVTAQQLNISERVLDLKLCRLAAAQVGLHRLQRLALEVSICRSLPPSNLITYLDTYTYDGTPMKAAVRDVLAAEAPGSEGAEAPVFDADLSLMQELVAKGKLHSSSCKILQTRQCFGMLLRTGDQLWSLRGDSLTPLQVLERNTAEVLKDALQRSACCSPQSQAFQFKARVVCTDRAGANIKAERSLAAERGPAWQTLHTFCDLHAVSSALVGTFDGLMPDQVSGLIRCALSLREGSALSTFRRCLRQEIRQRLVVLRGQPSIEAQNHKNLIFNIFFSAGRKQSLSERLILAKLPNGDWRNRREVEYYIPDRLEPPRNKAAISQLLEAGLSYALVGKKPSVWARHRWTGADLAVEELGRLECVHGLLRPTYQRFIHTYKGSHITLARGEEEEDDAVEDPTGQKEPSHPVLSSATASEGDAGLESGQHSAEFMTPSAAAESTRTAEEHAKDRLVGSRWLSEDVQPYLILLRLGLAPVSDLLHQLFTVTSETWEMQQQAAAAKALEEDWSTRGLREYIVTVAAQGSLELSFFRAFPMCVFQIPHAPEKAEELSKAPTCVMDEWSRQLHASFPSFSGPGFLETLELHAQLASNSIGVIESRHSSVRRQLATKSVQTHSLQMAALSSQWIMQNIRRGRAGLQSQQQLEAAPTSFEVP